MHKLNRQAGTATTSGAETQCGSPGSLQQELMLGQTFPRGEPLRTPRTRSNNQAAHKCTDQSGRKGRLWMLKTPHLGIFPRTFQVRNSLPRSRNHSHSTDTIAIRAGTMVLLEIAGDVSLIGLEDGSPSCGTMWRSRLLESICSDPPGSLWRQHASSHFANQVAMLLEMEDEFSFGEPRSEIGVSCSTERSRTPLANSKRVSGSALSCV